MTGIDGRGGSGQANGGENGRKLGSATSEERVLFAAQALVGYSVTAEVTFCKHISRKNHSLIVIRACDALGSRYSDPASARF